jgi:uncharacterized protein with PIN domain
VLKERPSVKDVIEACGVPHPEVDLILVNGQPTNFAFVLDGEAEVAIYGTRSRSTFFPKDRLQIATAESFIADVHLGKLTRNLRALGVDVACSHPASDKDLLDSALAENRILLSRDRRLLMHRVVENAYCPRSDQPLAQTLEVIVRFNLESRLSPFTRCIRCNGLLQIASKAEVIDKLEPLSRIFYHEFRRCLACGHVYWRGSHFDKLQRRVDEIRARLARSK